MTTRAGNDAIVLTVDGQARRYLLHVPRTGVEPRPAVLMLHGAGATAAWAREETRFDLTADREGFAVAYPDGLAIDPKRPSSFLDNPQVWNAGAGPGLIVNRGPDDVAFLDAVIADLPSRAAVNPRRIFVTGFSNGAAMTFRFAAERPTSPRAIAPVAGYCPFVLPIAPPMPTLFLVGSDDPLIPIAGGDIRSPWDGRVEYRPPLLVSLARWARAFGLDPTPRLIDENGDVRTEQFGDADDMFRWKTIRGLGHHWPGGRGRLKRSIAGKSTSRVSANDWIWAFFQSHS